MGGGITGAAVARDAASRGLRAALVEKNDWASGTSWRSSKLVHGGLRYLRSGQLHLVFESLAERARLTALAPHLVEPLEFLLPAYRRRGPPPLLLRLGLTLYDLLALGTASSRHRVLSRSALLARERLLESPDLLSGAGYADARTDDARLTLENALDAAALGATAVSRVEVESFRKDRSGRIVGVETRDAESGRRFPVTARVVINATGAWADALRRRDEPRAPPHLRLSKGAHLTVPASRLRLAHPVAAPAGRGRLLFAIPFDSVTLVGTTDTEYEGSLDEVRAHRAEVDFLLKAASETFPSARLTSADVLSTFAALRPLQQQAGRSLQDTSREDAVIVSESGLVTVFGGKLTTHRRMGERAMARVREPLARAGVQIRPSLTASRRYPGAPDVPFSHFLATFSADAAAVGLEEGTARHLAKRYGRRAPELLALVTEERGLAQRLVGELPDIAAEVIFAARCEDALSASDVLMRRTHLFWQAPGHGLDALDLVSDLLRRELGWDQQRTAASRADYVAEVEASRQAAAAPSGIR